MNRLIATAAAGIVSTLICSGVQAAPFVDINFDADTVGNAPAVAPVGPVPNPLTTPTAIGGYTASTADNPPTAANGTLVVADVAGLDNAAHLTTNPANGVTGALWLDVNGMNYPSQQVQLSFDVAILAAPTTATVQPKLLNGGPATAGIVLGMNTFSGTSSPLARFAAAPTSAGGGVFAIRTPDNLSLQTFFNYVEGEAYNVKLFSDYDTGVVSTYVDGVFTGNFPFAAGPLANTSTSEFFFHLNGEAGVANSVALDNISAVPEPTGLALLGLGAVALGARRRSAKQK